MRVTLRGAAILPGRAFALSLLLGAGCGGASPTGVPLPAATPPPTVAPAPPSTVPPPTSPGNRSPEVAVSGGGSCHPRMEGATVDPCVVTFEATAADPDGDHLTYQWSGCASGEARIADCAVDVIGRVKATVRVRDGRGGEALAQGRAEGVNQPPPIGAFGCQSYGCPSCLPLPPHSSSFCMWGGFPSDNLDADGDRISCLSARADGPCTDGGFFECGGVADAATFDFRTEGAGTCTFQVVLQDAWGATAAREVTVSVGP